MGKTRNIALKDPYDRNLLETFIANQQMLLAEQQRIEQLIDQRLNAMEAQLCSALKKPEKDVPELFTEKQLIKMTQYTRQTLYKYREIGWLTYTKIGRSIRYSQADIDHLKERVAEHSSTL